MNRKMVDSFTENNVKYDCYYCYNNAHFVFR